MLPCSREMQAMNSLLNPTQQIPLQDLQINGHQQIHTPQFDPTSFHDDFLEQMLSTTVPSSSWSDLKSPWDPPKSDETGPCNLDNNAGFHYDEILASKLRQHQTNGGGGNPFPTTAAMKMMMQQQMMLVGRATVAASGGGIIDGSSFKSTNHQGSLEALYNQSLNQPPHFHHPQVNFGATAATEMNQSQGSDSIAGAAPAQPKQRVRARRGQATDPHSIAERLRRVRIAERMKALQELVPNANKTDKASMLDEIIDYVKFLQLQVKVLSMSRLGGAAAVAPLVSDMPPEGGGDGIQPSANGGSLQQNFNGNQTSSANDSQMMTEYQVAKLMEEDMGSAMQYLQGKGLCLMPISLATVISTATSHSRNPMINNVNPNNGDNSNHILLQSSGGDGPSSPIMSVLTVQSAAMGNGGINGSIKVAASVTKP